MGILFLRIKPYPSQDENLVAFSLLLFGLISSTSAYGVYSNIPQGNISQPEVLDITDMDGNIFEEDYNDEEGDPSELEVVPYDEFISRSAVSCNSIERELNSYRRSRGLGNLVCDSALRELSLKKSYDHEDDACPTFCKTCGGHGWNTAKWASGCPTQPCNCHNYLLNKFFSGSGLFHNGEITAYHSNVGYVKGNAVTQWKGSYLHDKLMRTRSATHVGCNHFQHTANCNFGQK